MKKSVAIAVFGAVLLAASMPRSSSAQTTAERLADAVGKYERFDVEAARPILLNIISPGYLQPVTAEQKATAFKYLGASFVVLGTTQAAADSAKNFFIAALDFDPFTDLEQSKFAAAEIGAFNDAKRQIFKVGILPMRRPWLIDPRSQADSLAYVFRLITTQRAQIRVELLSADSVTREILYEGPNEGARGIPWRGVMRDGSFPPRGIYTFRVRGVPTLPAGAAPTTETINFQIEHIVEPLEDTLPTFKPEELLEERIKPSAPWKDLAKGGALALVSVGLPLVALNSDIAWAPHAGVAAGIGLGAATFSFSYRRRNPQIPVNVTENDRRRRQRMSFNAAVTQRNAGRISRTLLVISPLSGFAR